MSDFITTPVLLSASTLNGTSVQNPQGEELGELEEIMFDVHTGRISYAVLSFGGFLGLGNKLFAIPWEALRVNQDDHLIILDAEKEVLEKAPGFDKDDWPDTSTHDWLVDVYNYYGYRPYWQ